MAIAGLRATGQLVYDAQNGMNTNRFSPMGWAREGAGKHDRRGRFHRNRAASGADQPDTDAAYLAQQLSSLGISVYHRATVGDNLERAIETVRQAVLRAPTSFF